MRRRLSREARLRRWASPFVAAAYCSYASLLKARPPCIWTFLDSLRPLRTLSSCVRGGVVPGLVFVLALAGVAAAQPPPGPAAGADATDIAAARGAAAAALERWDLPAAREALERLGAVGEPADLLLASHGAFLAGDYAEAKRFLDRMPASAVAHGSLAAHARLVAASLALDGRLAVLEGEHFVVRFDPELDWILAEPALEALESGRAAIGAWLGERTSERVRVEIVPSAEEFAAVSGLTRRKIEAGSAVGLVDFNKIMVLSPRLLLRGYAWRDALNHEYLRYLLVRLGAGRAPAWLQRGLARLVEKRWRSPEEHFLDDVDRSLVARALREDRLVPLAEMERELSGLSSPAAVRLALAECALAVDHLITSHGLDGLRSLIAELAQAPAGAAFDDALRSSTGESLVGFEEGWRKALGARGYRELAGVVIPLRRLAGERTAGEGELAEWQPLAAQSHLRLGDLLRSRGNLRAALAEYEKARSVAPGSPYAHLKTARVLIELGQAEQAAAAARESRRFGGGYPAASVTLAAALAATGDREGAAAALGEALELNPFDPFVWRDLGRTLRRLGRSQEAQRASVNALRLVPNNQEFMKSVMEDQ